MKPYDVVAQLEATSGRLDKERIIRDAWDQGCVEFFEGAKLAYDVLITFGVKKVPLIEGDDDPTLEFSLEWTKFKEVLKKLQHRELTGNAARDVLRAAADSASVQEWNGWYRRIILKDLKCGITESTINKVLEAAGGDALDYVIPVFSCQLAKNGDDHPKKVSGRKYLDPKLDGVRIITILNIENNTVTQYTRDGRQNDRFELIAASFAKLLPFLKQSIVFDGEVVSRSFQELMRQLNRKKETNTSDAKLALFDIVPLTDFLAGECKMTQTDRHELLVGFMPLLAEHCDERVYVIPKMAVDLNTPEGQQQFKEFNRETLEAGYEGIMIKDPKSTYRTKRTDAWLKIKPFITVDLEIIDLEPGKADSRFHNTLGGIVCRGVDQGKKVEVTVGSGFSEELRDEIWNNRDKVIGRIAEIKGDALTKNRDSDDVWSVRFPTFMQFRGFEPGEKI
jgi:DNA ligase-1